MRITIIGPRSVGKTTTAKLLSNELGYFHEESDEVIDKLLLAFGGLSLVLKEKRKDLINDACEKRFAVALQVDNMIFDLSGGSLLIEENDIGKRTQAFIREKSVVIGLLPCVEDNDAIEFLYERERKRDHFEHLSNKELKEKVVRNYKKVKVALKQTAHIIIYVKDKTSEMLVGEIKKASQSFINRL